MSIYTMGNWRNVDEKEGKGEEMIEIKVVEAMVIEMGIVDVLATIAVAAGVFVIARHYLLR